MRIQELRELSFKLSYLPLVYPTFFLCVFLSHRSFSFRVLKKAGIRGCKVFRGNTTRRAGDFRRKQEAWPCIPVQSRNYLCAQNGNDYLMRLTERRENGGKRKWRQIGQENFKREIRKKGIMPKRKGTLPEAWNRANHRQGSMILYVWPSVYGRTDKIILPGLPAVCDGLFHLWIGRSDTAFRLRLKGTAKKKNRQKPVKAPLWHKRKRNGPCIISLNFCLGVRQSPFLRLCGSRHTFVQNLFGRWCADGQNRFYGKTYMWG